MHLVARCFPAFAKRFPKTKQRFKAFDQFTHLDVCEAEGCIRGFKHPDTVLEKLSTDGNFDIDIPARKRACFP